MPGGGAEPLGQLLLRRTGGAHGAQRLGQLGEQAPFDRREVHRHAGALHRPRVEIDAKVARLEGRARLVGARPASQRGPQAREQLAAIGAFREAYEKAKPVILEPIMSVEVVTPEDYMGDVIGDLNSRRGHIQAMEDVSGAKVVRALVPLSEMFGYVGELRSKTQGRANYSMQFDSYAEVPRNVADEIIRKTRGE